MTLLMELIIVVSKIQRYVKRVQWFSETIRKILQSSKLISLQLVVKHKMFLDMTEYLNKITAKKLGHFAIQMLI